MDARRVTLMLGICVLALGVGFCPVCLAADKEKDVTLTGVVRVTMKGKKDNKPETVRLAVGATVYDVQPNEKGRDLAQELDGKMAEVEGTLVTKKGDTVFHVKDFYPVVVGVVEATKERGADTPTDVKLKAGAEVYDITMNARGQELGEQMDGATVKVVGKITIKKERKEKVGEITVRSFALPGVVSAVFDRRDKRVLGVRFTAGPTVYNVVLDDTGKTMGETMDGKKIEVEGVITRRRDRRDDPWLKVRTYKETP